MKALIVILISLNQLLAHFGVLVGDNDVIDKGRYIELEGSFSHPFTQEVISKDIPNKIYLIENNQSINLLNSLKMDKNGVYRVKYPIKSSGDYIFISENKPYFEASEDKYITHITKVIINAYKRESDWFKSHNLKAEIVPLTRPYGLTKGMLFSGQVLQNSKPVKSATVEIELYNKDGIKSDFQNFKVITDEFGVFHFVSPYSGWIGFSALLEGEKIESKDSEIGAVLWINFR